MLSSSTDLLWIKEFNFHIQVGKLCIFFFFFDLIVWWLVTTVTAKLILAWGSLEAYTMERLFRSYYYWPV